MAYTVMELAHKVANNPKFAARIAANPAETLMEEAQSQIPDTTVYRIVVVCIGLAMLGALAAAAWANYQFQGDATKLSPFIVSIGSTALGALAGLLAPSPKS